MKSRILLSLAAAIFALGSIVAAPNVALADKTDKSAQTETETIDKLILRSGRVVEGEILEETEEGVLIRIVMFGTEAERLYKTAEILEVKRDLAIKPEAETKSSSKYGDDDEYKASRSDEEADSILYVINLEDTFGVHSSETPLEEAFEAVDEYFNDLDRSGRVRSDVRDNNLVVIKMNTQTDPRQGFDGIWRAEGIAPVIERQIVDKNRRVIFWIENASGGASFLPWVSEEIYFMSDGIMGGIGSLDDFDIGDDMVNEKQISLRLGHAEGFAIKGGYAQIGPPIIRAMARQQNWLCVKWEGGEPVFRESEPPEGEEHLWQVLTDSGEGKFKDDEDTAYKGNDILRINSDLALKLRLADGVADDIDDLAFQLGVDASYAEVEDNRANKIIEAWGEDIERAIDQVSRNRPGELWIEYGEIRVDGDYSDRRKARGQQINTLKQIRSIVNRYAEVFDPDGSWRADLDVRIEAHQMEQIADKNAQRSRRRG